jgi:ribulose-5-phosphate 4-epimerase/fuculose-1-phosphate aldolase
MSGYDEAFARAEVAKTAKMLARAGLVEGFGHVSFRFGQGCLITSTMPLHDMDKDSIVKVDPSIDFADHTNLPLETPLHIAIYESRTDVQAICRGHGNFMVVYGAMNTNELPALHGLGLLAGKSVKVFEDVELITSFKLAEKVANALGDNYAMLLRGNGGFAVGKSLIEAAVRLYFLEERARVAVLAGTATEHIDWSKRLAYTGAELKRACKWFESRFGQD